jgi:hypothetical protein
MTDDTTNTTPAVDETDEGHWGFVPWSQMGRKRQGRLLLGVIVFVVSVGYTVAAFQIPLGAIDRPGAGMFPRAVGFVACAISLWLIVESLIGRAKVEDVDLPRGRQLRLVLIFFGGTVAFVVLLPVLGQYICGALYMVAMIKFLSDWPWWKALAFGVPISAAIAWIFINLLQVPLPAGIFFPS